MLIYIGIIYIAQIQVRNTLTDGFASSQLVHAAILILKLSWRSNLCDIVDPPYNDFSQNKPHIFIWHASGSGNFKPLSMNTPTTTACFRVSSISIRQFNVNQTFDAVGESHLLFVFCAWKALYKLRYIFTFRHPLVHSPVQVFRAPYLEERVRSSRWWCEHICIDVAWRVWLWQWFVQFLIQQFFGIGRQMFGNISCWIGPSIHGN